MPGGTSSGWWCCGAEGASAVAGAQSGKTTIENNFLSSKEARQFDEELVECKASGGD
ncbi:VENN motif pre-toxin domain-containing protein, partial [Escherichia albertii]|uniref:VENN motif pre-toxin domain-containing protein n=1 Tax=Escherichia albertii TaxID=208962 RepID=UPI0018E48ECA